MSRVLKYMDELILLVVSLGAGFLGAILGIGGGLIIVPLLTLYFGVDIRYAIAASLVAVVATSSGAAASYLKDQLTNLRVAVFLEVGTVFGALTGFYISYLIDAVWLYYLFAFFLVFSAFMMLRGRKAIAGGSGHKLSEKWGFNSQYPVEGGAFVPYTVERAYLGLFLMYVAGIFSALLGIGSGVLKVLAMDNAMRLPMKVSSATSNFMIGVTAVASAGAYFVKGDIHPSLVVPIVLGILAGSWVGASTMKKMESSTIRKLFVVLLFVVASQMIYKGLNS